VSQTCTCASSVCVSQVSMCVCLERLCVSSEHCFFLIVTLVNYEKEYHNFFACCNFFVYGLQCGINTAKLLHKRALTRALIPTHDPHLIIHYACPTQLLPRVRMCSLTQNREHVHQKSTNAHAYTFKKKTSYNTSHRKKAQGWLRLVGSLKL